MAKQDELAIINKHVRTDGTQNYYWHPTRRQWLPGSYDGRRFVWSSTARFSARQRAYEMADGTTKQVRTTRYTSGAFLKPDASPKGRSGREYARAYKECHHAIYWDGERMWSACNVRVSEDRWINSLEPFTGRAYDAHPDQSEAAGVPVVAITCEQGRPVSVEMDGESFPWSPEVAPTLQLRAPEERTEEPEQTTEQTTTTKEPEQGATERERERERLAALWVESTTAPGEQMDLFAYASYGNDAIWQDLNDNMAA